MSCPYRLSEIWYLPYRLERLSVYTYARRRTRKHSTSPPDPTLPVSSAHVTRPRVGRVSRWTGVAPMWRVKPSSSCRPVCSAARGSWPSGESARPGRAPGAACRRDHWGEAAVRRAVDGGDGREGTSWGRDRRETTGVGRLSAGDGGCKWRAHGTSVLCRCTVGSLSVNS